MSSAETVVSFHRDRREGAKAMQRMWRYYLFKKDVSHKCNVGTG